jgi:hypothetical protein
MAEETTEWPPEDERDLAMGSFMYAWSRVEMALHSLFRSLSGTSDAVAHAIANAIPDVGRMAELLTALGALHLTSDDQKELAEIRKYLLIQGRYRNSIVHGFWGLRPNSTKRPIDGVIHQAEWVRVYYVIDKAEMGRSVIGKDEKGHDKYVFNLPRLQERAEKALLFSSRIDALTLKLYRHMKAQRDNHSS